MKQIRFQTFDRKRYDHMNEFQERVVADASPDERRKRLQQCSPFREGFGNEIEALVVKNYKAMFGSGADTFDGMAVESHEIIQAATQHIRTYEQSCLA